MVTGVLVAAFAVFTGGQAAQADGGQSADEGYVMVQQALSFLVNEPNEAGTAQALKMLDDALAAEDQDGVDVAKVSEGRDALIAGDVAAARSLLEDSISQAIAELKPAVGDQTGTTIVLGPIAPRGPLGLIEWMLVALSALALAVGIAFAAKLRPRESLAELGRDISEASAYDHEESAPTSLGGK